MSSLATLRQHNPKEPVPGFVARRVIEDRERGEFKHDIASRYRISVSAVDAILDHHRLTGKVREPQPGRGKKNDPRWILAGEDGAGHLKELEHSRDRLDDDVLLLESYEIALREGSDGLRAADGGGGLGSEIGVACPSLRLWRDGKDRAVFVSLMYAYTNRSPPSPQMRKTQEGDETRSRRQTGRPPTRPGGERWTAPERAELSEAST